MPKISIIVPVYQVEKYLRRCLDSIVAQTFTDWECILVDDGSPDNSGKICDEYAEIDNRFRVFHQENAGVSAARNKGLDVAKGEWITFVDSNDYIEEDYLQSFNPDELENGSLYVHSNYYREEKYQTKVFGIAENEQYLEQGRPNKRYLLYYYQKNGIMIFSQESPLLQLALNTGCCYKICWKNILITCNAQQYEKI